MLAVFPFNDDKRTDTNCYSTGPLMLYYNNSNGRLLCSEINPRVAVYLDGPDLLNSSQIFKDASCNCADPGFYMDPNNPSVWYELDRRCTLKANLCK